MRHAEAQPHADADIDRPLTDRGRAAAAEAGEFLRSIGIEPDHVLLSPAVRCVETWDEVGKVLQCSQEPQVTLEQGVYAAAPDSLLLVLRGVPESARTVLLIGHNPSVAYLASVLADADGSTEILQELLNGLLPGALAVYETSVPWAELDMLCALPTHFRDGTSS